MEVIMNLDIKEQKTIAELRSNTLDFLVNISFLYEYSHI